MLISFDEGGGGATDVEVTDRQTDRQTDWSENRRRSLGKRLNKWCCFSVRAFFFLQHLLCAAHHSFSSSPFSVDFFVFVFGSLTGKGIGGWIYKEANKHQQRRKERQCLTHQELTPEKKSQTNSDFRIDFQLLASFNLLFEAIDCFLCVCVGVLFYDVES